VKKVARVVAPALVISMFAVSSAVADWTVSKDPLGPGWLVSNGDKTVRAKTEKNAKKKARLLNKNAAEFKAGSEGPCADPSSGIRC
jgi:hypothetical protein